MVKSFVPLVIGIILGLSISCLALNWVMVRDRTMIELASDTGYVSFNLNLLKESSDSELKCKLLKLTLARNKHNTQRIEMLGSPRFYEPSGWISVLENSTKENSIVIHGSEIQSLAESCR